MPWSHAVPNIVGNMTTNDVIDEKCALSGNMLLLLYFSGTKRMWYCQATVISASLWKIEQPRDKRHDTQKIINCRCKHKVMYVTLDVAYIKPWNELQICAHTWGKEKHGDRKFDSNFVVSTTIFVVVFTTSNKNSLSALEIHPWVLMGSCSSIDYAGWGSHALRVIQNFRYL